LKGSLSGGPGDDNPVTSRAVGMLDGGPGADVISGGPGHDFLYAGSWPRDSAVDTLKGGDGNDFLDAENRPAARDIVSCGAGRDGAWVDRKDIVSGDCERV
jgi:Ca2+-binding RTX toxin-like protein